MGPRVRGDDAGFDMTVAAATTGAAGTRSWAAFMLAGSARTVVGSVSVVLFLIVWQIVGVNDIVRSDLISYPSEIAATLVQMSRSGELGANALVSLEEFIQGLVPAIAVGIAAGTAFGLSRRLHYLCEPLIVALNTSPIIAFVPIVVVWFGVGTQSKAIMVFLAAVIPIVINTMTGITQVHESWIRACRAFGAGRWQVIAKAVLPGALPSVMVGVRLSVGRAIVGLVAAEMYVSVRGIGRLIQVYSTSERAANIFVLVAVVSGFGFLLVTGLRRIEGLMAPWSLEQ
jgi:ABC-type nitrate/sulfonate/bicarbonate transport system permease component